MSQGEFQELLKVKISRDQKRRLHQHCSYKGRSFSDVIREAIDRLPLPPEKLDPEKPL